MQRPDRLQLPSQQAQDSPRERECCDSSNYTLSQIRVNEAFGDVQRLRKECFAACRPVLQCRSEQAARIRETSQKPIAAEDRTER